MSKKLTPQKNRKTLRASAAIVAALWLSACNQNSVNQQQPPLASVELEGSAQRELIFSSPWARPATRKPWILKISVRTP